MKDPNPLVGTSIFYRGISNSETHTSNWSEVLAKGPCQKSTLSAVMLELTVYTLRVQAFLPVELSWPPSLAHGIS